MTNKQNSAVGLMCGGVGIFLVFGFGTVGKCSAQDVKLDSSKPMPTIPQDGASDIGQLRTQVSRAFNAGDYDDALVLANRICKLKPESIGDWLFLGDVAFAAGSIKSSIAAYDEAIRLRPAMEPQLWQRGLALYYAGRFSDGVKQFETHQTVNSQDVENAVWHLLCASRISDVESARKKLIPITGDTRVPMSQIYEMFADRMTPAEVLIVARGSAPGQPDAGTRQELPQYYAQLYIGLYHEMLGEHDLALEAMKKATEINPLGKANFMGQVARVHLKLHLQLHQDRKKRTPASGATERVPSRQN